MASTSAPALPHPRELEAPRAWRAIDFISDLHLQASHPLTLAAFAAHLRHTDADAVFLLGDVFEAWVGDDARHGGSERAVTEVLQAASARLSLAFMAGNRDFLVGAEMLRDCGMLALSDPTVLLAFGERVLLTHGDALCLDDADYQRFRIEVRSADWQVRFLALPLAERRALAARMRDASRQHQRDQQSAAWSDIDAATAVQWMQAASTRQMIHGHTHRPGSGELAPGFMRWVLTDWDADHEPHRASVLRLSRRGLERRAPARAA